MDISRKRKRSTSDMVASNKLSRTSNALNKGVRVEPISNNSNIKLMEYAIKNSDTDGSNKLSRTSKCLNTDVKVEEVDNLSNSNIKFTKHASKNSDIPASNKLPQTSKCLKTNVKIEQIDILPSSNIKFTKHASKNSNMGDSNKFVQTSKCLNTDVKVEQIANLSKSNIKLTIHDSKTIKSTQKTNYNNLDVDLILDHKVFKNQIFYLVKRKNQNSKYSVWEPAEKLMGCANVLYYQQVIVNSLEIINEKIILFFVNDLVTRQPQDILTLTKLCALVYSCTEEVISGLRLTFADLKVKALKVLDIPLERLNKKKKSLYHLMRFSEVRKRVLNACAEWEKRINQTSQAYVRVENHVDLEEPPSNYRYIRNYESRYVDLTARPVVRCDCDNCFEGQASCCAHQLKGSFAYDAEGRVQLPNGFEIYECNHLCKCGQECPNRVVQRGPVVKLSIFRTSNGCGWGLKTLEDIKKGQFVLEYLGEVITPMDADVRDEAYDWTGATYLFDLGPNGAFTVDAGLAGNASRFINHACDPNLQVYTVFGEQQDPGLPRLAFFSRRRVRKGEQLTFDYKMQGDLDYLQGERDRIRCRCGSKNCRKYLF